MSKLWQKLIRPIMFGLDAERAHELGIEALKLGLGGLASGWKDVEFDPTELFGLKFANPLGIAAGFDKNGVVVNQLASMGFGFVEVGTVTHKPQPGNPKPRMFRLPEDKALINQLGFNNDGAVAVAERLKKLDRRCIVGVNIGRNKDVPNEEATENYLKCFEIIHGVADYVAVNVSSPNTPNLRELQRGDSLEELLGALKNRNVELGTKPLLVKIAPDLTEGEIETVVDIVLRFEISGIIATNTTILRDGLVSQNIEQIGAGGLSGKPLEKRANDLISAVFRHTKGRLPIIGVGGLFTAEDAFAKIAAGASLIQAYTGFVYGGPGFAKEINNGLSGIIKRRGFRTFDEAVGTDSGFR
ncbi:MAG: quinone-dependent dihydroorotate dehydrogenase [Chloracidobacterium sp.]|nr:quinone-dependent dihydroorotate dehydrogenase [Chloracidobacterium sp.]